MSDTESIQYRVTEVKRYNVTRFYRKETPYGGSTGGVESLGMFDNEVIANRIADALCSLEPGAEKIEPKSEIR